MLTGVLPVESQETGGSRKIVNSSAWYVDMVMPGRAHLKAWLEGTEFVTAEMRTRLELALQRRIETDRIKSAARRSVLPGDDVHSRIPACESW